MSRKMAGKPDLSQTPEPDPLRHTKYPRATLYTLRFALHTPITAQGTHAPTLYTRQVASGSWRTVKRKA